MKMVIGCACADCRRNNPLNDQAHERKKAGIKNYFIREAGGALQYAGFFWFFAALRLLPLLKAGGRIVELEQHRDCAGLTYQRNKLREKLVLWVRRIKSEEEHQQWILARATKRIIWFARWAGYRDVVVFSSVVDAEQPYVAASDDILRLYGTTAS